MAIKFASGRDVASTPLLEAEFPFTLDPEIYKGAWIITLNGDTFYSDGDNWIPTAASGIEIFQPPWEPTPDGWFNVTDTLPGSLANRGVIASKFDINYVTPDARTWPIVTPFSLFLDDEGTVPVLSAPESIGLLEDSTVPQINWFQDVNVDRPQWKQITRTVDGVEKTIDVLEFDNLGQNLKVDFLDQTTGSMVHVTSNGIYILGVDIPAGTYEFGRWQIWDIEEIILLDRYLNPSEITRLVSELGKQRNRVTEANFGSDWTNAFRGRTEIISMPSFDFTGVTSFERAFQNSAAESWLTGSFFDTAVNVTIFQETFRNNAITSIPAGLFDNTVNVTSFRETFVSNDLTSIPDGLFDNNPNVTNFNRTFYVNSLTSIPDGLFDNNVNVTNFIETFRSNSLTSIPAGLFDNNPNVTSFSLTFYDNDLTSIPDGLFDNNPNVTNFSLTFYNNALTSIPAGLFDNTVNVTSFRETFVSNDLTSIPDGLFDNNPNVTNFGRTFEKNALTSIPAGLFDNNPNATDFFETFVSNDLTSIPDGLFDNNPNVTNFSRTFEKNALTSIPAGLFDNNVNVTNFFETFLSNSLTSIPAGLFDTQTQATNYEDIFGANDLDQTSVDNVLVSVQTSADANNLDNGILGIDGGTNATPSATGQAAADALRARGWTVNLNGY